MAGFFLTTSVLLWWARMYRRARELGLGTHTAWAFASAIWLYLVARLHPAAADGPLERGGAVRHLPASRLDRRVLDPLRQPVLQSVPHALDRVPLRLGAAVRDARRRPSSRSAATAASARSSRSSTAAPRRNAPRCSGAGRWASTRRWNRSIAGPGGSRCWSRSPAASASCSPARSSTTGISGACITASRRPIPHVVAARRRPGSSLGSRPMRIAASFLGVVVAVLLTVAMLFTAGWTHPPIVRPAKRLSRPRDGPAHDARRRARA